MIQRVIGMLGYASVTQQDNWKGQDEGKGKKGDKSKGKGKGVLLLREKGTQKTCLSQTNA